jgi:hypothetical protein
LAFSKVSSSGDGNNFIQTRRFVRLVQQVAIALQHALRVDFPLRAKYRAYAGDDIAEPTCQNR